MEQKAKEKCPLCGQEMDDKATKEKVKIENLKELYKRYCTCRDAELDRFWKNSVFVWVFLALCFTAFGKVLLDYLEIIDQNNDAEKEKKIIMLAVISYCGFFMSTIWTWMARGLKAWYEVYESAIWDMESNKNVFGFDRNYTIENYWSVKANGIKSFNSDSYSPSKIVILIGYLLSFIWFIAYCYFLYKSFKCINPIKFTDNNFIYWSFLSLSVCYFIFVLLQKNRSKNLTKLIPIILLFLVLFILKSNYNVSFDFELVFNRGFWCILSSSLLINYICSIYIKSSSLRTPKENVIFQKMRTYLNTFDNKKEISKLYYEVKDNYINFFFSNKENKESLKNNIDSCFEPKEASKANWFKKKWGNIIEWFKSEYSDTDFTYSINIKDKILNEAEESNENTNINTTDNETTNKKEN